MSFLSSLLGSTNNNANQPNPTPAAPVTPVAPVDEGPQGLDKFTDIMNFTPDPKDVKEPFDANKLLEVNPEALQAEISKMNFVEGVISEKDAEAIAGGGEGALAAMAKALNAVGQNVFMKATLAAKAVSSKTLEGSMSHIDERFNSSLRKSQINSAILESNPNLAHPVAKVMIDAYIPKLEAKFPNATPAEIKDRAAELVASLIDTLSPVDKSKEDKAKSESMDWLDWAKDA